MYVAVKEKSRGDALGEMLLGDVISFFFNALYVMLGFRFVHDGVSASVPTPGYWTSGLLALLVMLILDSATFRARLYNEYKDSPKKRKS